MLLKTDIFFLAKISEEACSNFSTSISLSPLVKFVLCFSFKKKINISNNNNNKKRITFYLLKKKQITILIALFY